MNRQWFFEAGLFLHRSDYRHEIMVKCYSMKNWKRCNFLVGIEQILAAATRLTLHKIVMIQMTYLYLEWIQLRWGYVIESCHMTYVVFVLILEWWSCRMKSEGFEVQNLGCSNCFGIKQTKQDTLGSVVVSQFALSKSQSEIQFGLVRCIKPSINWRTQVVLHNINTVI